MAESSRSMLKSFIMVDEVSQSELLLGRFLIELSRSWPSGTRSRIACRVRVVKVVGERHDEVGVTVPVYILFAYT